MNSRGLQLLGLGIAAVALGWLGQVMLFGIFMLYDDEGYVLISLRDYGLHGGLYEQVYSQYGPAFFAAYDVLRRLLDFEWTNTAGRWLTLANWLGTVGLGTFLLFRLRLSWALLLYALVSSFTYLWNMIREPSHPGSLVTLVVALSAYGGWEALRSGRMDRFALLLGASGAFLALVKINVGVFLILAAVYWLALTHRGTHAGRVVLLLIGAGWLLCVALMRTLLAEDWVVTYIGVAGLGITGAALAATTAAREQEAAWSHWGWFAAGGLAVTALSAAIVLFRGTSWAGLWEGVILAPLRHPTVYTFPVRWRPGVVLVGLVAVALVALCLHRPLDPRPRLVVAWLRILTFGLFQLTLLPAFATAQAAIGLSYGVPLAGLFALPLSATNPAPVRAARAWIALLFVFQSLQAYPVAGSQISWGTWLWIPLMVLGLDEAIAHVIAPRTTGARTALRTGIAAVALGFAGYMLFTLHGVARHYQEYSDPLRLPGAERIGLPPSITASIRVVAENARAHSDVLFSMPGLYSYNLWTGVPTPTRANVTHWFSLLDDSRQQAVIDRMRSSPRSTLIVQQDTLLGLVKSGFSPRGPLRDYLQGAYHRALSVGNYTFWVKNDRTIAPLSTGMLHRMPEDAALPRLVLTLDARPGPPVQRIALRDLTGRAIEVLRLDPADLDRTYFTPLDLAGQPTGPRREVTWPFNLEELGRLEIEHRRLKDVPESEQLQAVLLSVDGQVVAEALLLRPAQLQPRPAAATATPPPAEN